MGLAVGLEGRYLEVEMSNGGLTTNGHYAFYFGDEKDEKKKKRECYESCERE